MADDDNNTNKNDENGHTDATVTTHKHVICSGVGSTLHKTLTCRHVISDDAVTTRRCGKEVHIGPFCREHWEQFLKEKISKNKKRKG